LTRYAWRRWLELLVVGATMLVKIGLDVLKPWPMIFLVDYVLQGKITSPIFPRLVVLLPGARTPENLVAWAVGATVLIFLLSWSVGLANAYANITLGQRMVYDWPPIYSPSSSNFRCTSTCANRWATTSAV